MACEMDAFRVQELISAKALWRFRQGDIMT